MLLHVSAQMQPLANLAGRGARLSAPRPDELEISVFGPGYGESIAVHLGDGRWMIVDSCIDNRSERPAALEYFGDIDVSCEDQVAIVLATHWHDDHIRGLAEILRACSTARFACSHAFSTREFLLLVESPALGTEQLPAGLREFAEILAILKERRAAGNLLLGTPELVNQKTVLDQSARCEVMSLSPSSATVMEAVQAFATLLPEPSQPMKCVPSPKANEGSVALWVCGASGVALLGADLERNSKDDRGWGAVLGCAPLMKGRASLVKVPHHGSSTGHDQRMWDELLVSQPHAMLTPWELGGRHVPDAADRDRICALAPAAVIAGDTVAKLDRYQPAVERTLREATISRQAAIGRTGHIRARCTPSDKGQWRVDLIHNSQRLCAA